MEIELSKKYPVLPTRNVVIFAGTTLPLNIGRPRSVAAIEAANERDGLIIALAQKSEVSGEPGSEDVYAVGTLCKVEKMRGSSENGYQVLVRGMSRVKVYEFAPGEQFIEALAEPRVRV